MTGEVLLDTDIVVYAYDRIAGEKQKRAARTMSELVVRGSGSLSTQVLAEFFRVVTRKLRPTLPPAEAYQQVASLARAWPVLPVTPLIVLEAARGVRDYRLGYWDAQVWATASLNQIEVVLSEDFAESAVIEGVRFVDPFAPSFDLTALV